jgi:hypothetical protein
MHGHRLVISDSVIQFMARLLRDPTIFGSAPERGVAPDAVNQAWEANRDD